MLEFTAMPQNETQKTLEKIMKIVRRLVIITCVLSVLGGLFAYGILVGRLKLFPYSELRALWSDLPHSVKHQVAVLTQSEASTNFETVIETNLLALEQSAFNTFGEFGIDGSGGSLELVNGRVVGIDAGGQLFEYKAGAVDRLPMKVDLNEAAFAEHLRTHMKEVGRIEPALKYFRAMDMLFAKHETGYEVYVLHHYWDGIAQLRKTRVSRSQLSDDQFASMASVSELSWDVVFDATPGIGLDTPPYHAMTTNHTGGRLVLDAEGNLLIAIGEQRFDGIRYPEIAAQNPKSSYGKIIRLNRTTGVSEVFALGVRNPQGLLVDSIGRIWETEHGPRGGDELNLIGENTNYGWPHVTYGTDELSYEWPLSANQGRHDGFEKPVYAWVPSVGISNLIEIRNELSPWRGDLLVSSLAGVSLYRIRLENERVVLVEPIYVGDRVRDLVELDDGTIVILADNAKFIELRGALTRSGLNPIDLLSEQELAQGLDVVLQECGLCHSFAASSSHVAVAPTLMSVVGRRVSSTDYPNYSTALRALSGEWTPDQLEAFVLDPQKVAPGTAMPRPTSLTSPEQAANLVQFLNDLPSRVGKIEDGK